MKESEKDCWIGNFSRPSLKNEDDFLVKIQLTSLNDFDFHFDDCKVFRKSFKNPAQAIENYELTIKMTSQGLWDQHPTNAGRSATGDSGSKVMKKFVNFNQVFNSILIGQEAFHVHHITKAGEGNIHV